MIDLIRNRYNGYINTSVDTVMLCPMQEKEKSKNDRDFVSI